MADPNRSGMAHYHHVDGDYLQKRKLKKSARWMLLWAMGVGAVISGDFFGWNGGLLAGGFGGMALAVGLMAFMYICLVYSIAELSAALPHAGGFYSFTRSAFGPFGGFLCGATDTIEYVLTATAIAVSIGSYLGGLMEDLGQYDIPVYVWWLAAYLIFVTINIRGVEITFKFSFAITLLALAVLIIFFVSAIASGAFSFDLLFNISSKAGQAHAWLPMGWQGVFASLPFAIWFYLAIEQLPLAAEETHDVVNDMPKALTTSLATLVVFSLFTLVLNSGVGGGAAVIGGSKAPLKDGFEAVFGKGPLTNFLTLVALAGLVASFHNIIFAYGRVLFALSRAGYFPRWISLTSRYHTPHIALILGGLAGLVCAVIVNRFGDESAVGKSLLNMSVFGAVISYVLVLLSYIKLRISRPTLPRPYRSPLGVPGAVAGTLLATAALGATFASKEYSPAVVGLAFLLLLAVLYFVLYSRKHLVAQAPEEEVALVTEAKKELEIP